MAEISDAEVEANDGQGMGGDEGLGSSSPPNPPGLSQRELLRRAMDQDLSHGEFATGGSQQASSSAAYPQSVAGSHQGPSSQPEPWQQAIIAMSQAATQQGALLTQAMTGMAQMRSNQSIRREAENIKIPGLPKAAEIRTWERQVQQAIQAASGLESQSAVADWIYECTQDTPDPDAKFDTAACPANLQSLDTKLGVAMTATIIATASPPLRKAIDRLQARRQLERKPLWGGRRLLYEVHKFLRLTEDGEDRRAVRKLEALTWHGDDLSKLESWYDEALQACEGATRAGFSNKMVVDKLRECLEKSGAFRSTLETWLEFDSRNGKTEWHDLMSVFEERLITRRTRLAEQEADKHGGRGVSTSAGTAEGGHPPPSPPGPPSGAKTKNQRICERFAKVCRNHVLHNRCRNGDSCPRDHTPLGQSDLNALWHAAKELYPSEFRPRSGDSPASGQGAKEQLCMHLKAQKGCTWGDRCQWLHDWTAQEYARVQKVRAERLGAESPRNLPAGGVHAQAYDPDAAWSGWPQLPLVERR